jgi:hypothetical protein
MENGKWKMVKGGSFCDLVLSERCRNCVDLSLTLPDSLDIPSGTWRAP